jgi:hypothetical protein
MRGTVKITDMTLDLVTADKGYGSEDSHVLVREKKLHVFSVIPARYVDVPIWRRTHGRYRKKQMKRGYSKVPLYNQRDNKDETIISAIKRLFGEHLMSRLIIRTQNRELSFRCITYNNMHTD